MTLDRFAHPTLVVVDMQNDFVRVGAPLEVPEARATIPAFTEPVLLAQGAGRVSVPRPRTRIVMVVILKFSLSGFLGVLDDRWKDCSAPRHSNARSSPPE
jgi:hypothetical protein